jgi:hypothetical protein
VCGGRSSRHRLWQADMWSGAKQPLTVCLVGEPRERSGADPRFGDGSDPSHVWLQMLGWTGSNLFFCLVGGLRLGMDGNFHSVSGSHMS